MRLAGPFVKGALLVDNAAASTTHSLLSHKTSARERLEFAQICA
jgi:hypothetical protein